MQIDYMKAAHGNWLLIPFDSPLRNELKIKYGVCAAKEKESVGVEPRLRGIPTLLGESVLFVHSAYCTIYRHITQVAPTQSRSKSALLTLFASQWCAPTAPSSL